MQLKVLCWILRCVADIRHLRDFDGWPQRADDTTIRWLGENALIDKSVFGNNLDKDYGQSNAMRIEKQ